MASVIIMVDWEEDTTQLTLKTMENGMIITTVPFEDVARVV